MDIVYIVRPGDDNVELRYSLRSLVNIPHENVWLVGHQPQWVQDVNFIPGNKFGGKFDNGRGNIVLACQSPDISRDFILMNDDFFVLGPVAEIPVYHRGTIEDELAKKDQRNEWHHRLDATRRWLRAVGKPTVCYELHAPVVLNRQKMLDVLAECARFESPTLERSSYFNFYGAVAERLRDPKITAPQAPVRDPAATYFSTADKSFRSGVIGEFIRSRLTTPSRHERPIRRGSITQPLRLRLAGSGPY